MHDHPNPAERVLDGAGTRFGLRPGIPLAHHGAGLLVTPSVSKDALELGVVAEPERMLETLVAVTAVELGKMLVT